MAPSSVVVDLGARSYPIHIGSGILAGAASYIAPHLKGQKIAIITDENVAALHLEALLAPLSAEGLSVEVLILPAGENEKSFARLEDVLGRLLEMNFSRSDTLIAFGGGVIGDLTGFAASILKRGCGFIQIPTTLLAQVDSSVGGKTAINTGAGKNLVGAFYQPQMVLTDTDVLQTLPLRELKSGYAEVLKYSLIDTLEFFEWLEHNGAALLAGDAAAQGHAISVSCRAKAKIVREDEFEHGRRALLNLGHSFGHALEGRAGFDGSVLHGEAVNAGMLMAFEYSRDMGLCADGDVQKLRAHLQSLDLPMFADMPAKVISDPAALFDYMMRDKKNTNDDQALILTRGIGRCFIEPRADQASVQSYLQNACAAAKV